MASQYEKLKQKALTKAKQNRTNRVTKKANYYGKKISKSQKDYIAGDVLFSASKRAYGYKQYGLPEQSFITGGRSKANYKKIQNGENPYEAKYLYTGKPTLVKGGTRADGTKYNSFISKKRMLTDEEKEIFKKTGDLNKKKYNSDYKYSVMSASNKDAKTFKEQLNTGKWDGLKVARNKVNSGSSKFEYIKGGLKDILVDPVVDALKTFDRYESALLGGISGGIEESANLFEAIADPKIKIKDNVNFRRPLENFKASMEESDKTGWGKSTADYFNEASLRNFEKEKKRIMNSSSYTDEHKKALIKDLNEKENSKSHQLFRNLVGFGADIANPISLGSAVAKGGKKLVGNATKSFDEMVKGTADISTAFKANDDLFDVGMKHKDMLERMKAYKKYLQEEYVPNLKKSGGKFDEKKAWEGFENSSQAEEYAHKYGYMANNIDQSINHSLDNGFNRAINKTDEIAKVVKSNPRTQNLGNFLDEIGRIDKGKQLSIDGRTLNKKYTQVKDGYVPQLSNQIDELNNAPNVDKNQLSMFNRNGNTNTYEKNLKLKQKRFEDWYNAYSDENMLFDMIDDLSDSNADGMLDWLAKNKPDTYARYMGNIDDVDNIADDGVKMFDAIKERDTKRLGDIARNSEEVKPQVKYDLSKFEELREENAIEQLLRIVEGSTSKSFDNSIARNKAFKTTVRDLTDNIMSGKIDIDDLTKTIDNILGNSVPPKVKREYINNKLFDGSEIIKSNVSNNELDSLLKSILDIIEVKRAEDIRQTTGELIDLNFSDTTKNFFKMLDGERVNLMSGKIGGVEMNETSEIYEKLSKGIADRSRSLTDSRYVDKLELLAREFGYKNYNNDILQSIDKIQKQMKALDNQPLTQEVLNQKLELSSNLKRLKQIQIDRDKLWKQIRGMNEAQFDDFMKNTYPQHMKGMQSYSPRTNQTKEINYLSQESTINKNFNEALENNLNEGVEARQSKHIDDLESLRGHRGGVDITKGDETFNESKLLKSVGLEPVINIPKLAKNYKPTYSHLEKMPGAKHVISNVKKLLTKIVDYDTPVVRKIDGKMQIAPHEFESKTLRKELNKQIQIMRNAGIEDYMWFEDIKKFKADLLKNTERGKTDFNELKGVSINRKVPNDVRVERDMNNKAKELFVQDEYERILNASNPEELFMSVDYDKYISQHGDSLGVKISDKSKNTIENSASDKLLKYFKGNERQFNNSLKVYEHYTNEQLLNKIAQSTINPNSKNALVPRVILEQRGVDYSNAHLKNVANYDNAPTTLEMYTKKNKELQEQIETRLKKEGKETNIPKGRILNESTGELESLNKHLFNGKFKPIPDVYDVADDVKDLKPTDIMKPKTFKPREPQPLKETHKFKKEGKEINLPKNYVVNETTGEVEDISKYLLGNKNTGHADVYDIADDVNPFEGNKTFETSDIKKALDERKVDDTPIEDYIKSLEMKANNNLNKLFKEEKPVSKEMQNLIDYVNDESLFSDFNESIGKKPTKPPTFEKFKELFEKNNPTMPYEENKLFHVYKSWLNSWKKGLTVYNPGWHVQNFFQNKGQNYLALGSDAFGSQKNARKVLDYIQGGENKADTILNNKGVAYTGEDIAKLAKELGVVNSHTNDVMRARGIIPPLETMIDNSGIMNKLGRSEETARLHHFMTQLKRGMTPEEASKSVNKYLFDYSNKSKIDKVMSDFIDPFWMFHKNYGKLLTGEAVQNPSKINNILRGERGLENGVESDEKHSETWGKFQSPLGSFKDPVNEQMYDYMYKQNLMPRLQESIPTDRQEIENKMNPLLVIALQQARGEGNFGNKIVEGEAGWNEVSKEDRNKEILNSVNPFMNPLIKALNKVEKHQNRADEGKQAQSTSDKQILQDWLEYILGHKANYYKRS